MTDFQQSRAHQRLLDQSETFQTAKWGLDKRLLKAVARIGYVYPTLVQSQSIPLALKGKDLLIKAKTGSGKTAAFALSVLHKLLQSKTSRRDTAAVRALVLVPSRELVDQTVEVFMSLMYYCNDILDIFGLSHQSVAEQSARLKECPDIIVSTPSRIVTHLENGALEFSDLMDTVVIDEADLVLSYGYADDMQVVSKAIPKAAQAFLMSATMSEDVDNLKKLVLQNPVTLKLEDDQTQGQLQQYFVKVGREDKFLLLYALIKLQLIAGKAIFFVNNLDNCYRLKLFLERISIGAAVLNAELPAASRRHILQQFNKGVFDYLIATDESVGVDSDAATTKEEEEELAQKLLNGTDTTNDDDASELDNMEDESNTEEEEASISSADSQNDEINSGEETDDTDALSDSVEEQQDTNDNDTFVTDDQETTKDRSDSESIDSVQDERKTEMDTHTTKIHPSKQTAKEVLKKELHKKKLASIQADLEFGIARGIDFHDVGTVVNVDFPHSVSAYIHRIGRTARGGASGAALSFVNVGPDRIPGKGSGIGQGPESAHYNAAIDAARASGYMNIDQKILARVQQVQVPLEDGSLQPTPLPFNIREIEGFRYRVSSVLRGVTKNSVKEARLAELRHEILHSDKLKAHFEDNPRDLAVLRHDVPLAPEAIKPELASVPSYLLPQSLRSAVEAAGGNAEGTGGARRKKGQKRARSTQTNISHADPLRTYAYNANQLASAGGSEKDIPDINGAAGALGLGGAQRARFKSVAGRNKWKQAHKKGQWSKKKQKTNRFF